MLVHCRVTPSSMLPVPIYTPVNRDNVEQSFLSKASDTLGDFRRPPRSAKIAKCVAGLRKQHSNEETNLALNQRPSDLPTVRSKVRRANHYTTAPPSAVSVLISLTLKETYLIIMPRECIGYVAYNDPISNNRECNVCFVKHNQEILPDLADFILQEQPDDD